MFKLILQGVLNIVIHHRTDYLAPFASISSGEPITRRQPRQAAVYAWHFRMSRLRPLWSWLESGLRVRLWKATFTPVLTDADVNTCCEQVLSRSQHSALCQNQWNASSVFQPGKGMHSLHWLHLSRRDVDQISLPKWGLSPIWVMSVILNKGRYFWGGQESERIDWTFVSSPTHPRMQFYFQNSFSSSWLQINLGQKFPLNKT